MQKSEAVIGKNLQTFSFDFDKKIKLNFDGGKLSSDTGMFLVHEFCRGIGVEELLREYLPENRPGEFLHEKPDILYQQILRIIAGYESNNAATRLKDDPVFQKIHGDGKKRNSESAKDGGAIASPSTCCRLEKGFLKRTDGKALQKVQEALLDRAYAVETPGEVWLDLDTTYDPAASSLHGAKFNTHYGKTGFSPLLCFEGKTGDMVKGYLRPGNTHCSTDAAAFLSPVLGKYKTTGVSIRVRGDSGFACPEVYEASERYGAEYFIKLKMNAVIKRKFEEDILAVLTEEELANAREKEREIYGEFRYGAKSWNGEKRILCRVQWKGDELFPVCSAIVTNDENCTPEEGFDFYNGRAVIENFIEEGKNGFSWDHLSHKSFESNAVRFQVFLTACLITNLFRRLCLPERQNRKTVQTLRTSLFKLASRVVKSGRDLIFKCASSFPFRDMFVTALENIKLLITSLKTKRAYADSG